MAPKIELLERILERGYRALIVIGDVVFIAESSGRMPIPDDATEDTVAIVCDLERPYRRLQAHYGRREEFASLDVAAAAGVAFGTLNDWIEAGVVTPSIRQSSGRGRGNGRVFDFQDVFAIGVVASLARKSVSRTVMAKVFRALTTGNDDALQELLELPVSEAHREKVS